MKRNEKTRYKQLQKRKLSEMAVRDSRQFWNTIKAQYARQTESGELPSIDHLYRHFESLLSGEAIESMNLDETESHNQLMEDEILDKDITLEELTAAVSSLKNNKSCGNDGLAAEIYKSYFNNCSQFLLNYFNVLLHKGLYPHLWGEGIICPILKGGDSSDPRNCRGVTLIKVAAKIYSNILNERLTKWTNREKNIIHNQFGFQAGRSTTDCVFLLHSVIAKTLSSGQKIYSIFVDLEKCYDRVNRGFLWRKLSEMHVSAKFIKALKAMYSNIKQCVRRNNEMSDFFNSNIGLKQGDSCSSLLYLLFSNDILNYLNSNIDGLFTVNGIKLFLILFDDAVLFAKTPKALQSLVRDFEQYCQEWGLRINVHKTKVMVFERGRNTQCEI